MVEVDGGFREGGGQILRTALSLSCLLQKPFRISNIRRGRKKPGLMPQHLTCVLAAKLISNARVVGDAIGASALSFFPGGVSSGEYRFDIGTAGSTSLVLQTIIPALAFSNSGKSAITLTGGTHVPFSPSFHYLANVFVPALKATGIDIDLSISAYGFYPKGGGKISAVIHPAGEIEPLKTVERGNLLRLKGFSGVGNLPFSIAERQKEALLRQIHSKLGEYSCAADIKSLAVPTPGQGTFVFLHSESENFIAGFTSLGARGKKAEVVGREAGDEFLEYYFAGAALDPHLADQIILYLAMCGNESIFSTSRITEHLHTNLRVIGLFHDYSYTVEGEMNQPGIVRIRPSDNKF